MIRSPDCIVSWSEVVDVSGLIVLSRTSYNGLS